MNNVNNGRHYPILMAFTLIACLIFAYHSASADTGDVIDDFLPAATDVWNCGGYATAVWADVDADGTFDTQVVLTTLSSTDGAGESSVMREHDGTGKWFFFSFIDVHCGGASSYIGRGRFTIHFVDMLAPGFVWNDPASWTYKAVPALSLRVSHDACYGYDDPRYDDPAYMPYLGVQGYGERLQVNPRDPVSVEPVGGWLEYRFSHPDGLKEIYLSTDFCENTLDNLVLYTHEIGPGSAGVPGLAMSFDTSGSMSWNPHGDVGVPADQQRLTHAKDAAIPIIEMMNDFNAGNAEFSISRFPAQPWALGSCNGQIITPSTVVDATSTTTVVGTTIPDLTATGSTPLLSGLSTALGTFSDAGRRAVLLLSDGYHNCPHPVEADDAAVTTAISNALAANAKIFTVGFGDPSDVDHPLLERLASTTHGAFFDVTGPTFDPATWNPRTALADAYVAILGDALGLSTAADPRGIIKPAETVTREIAINRHDQTIAFYLSWATRQAGRLNLSIVSSDEEEIPPTADGVTVHEGPTFKVVTVKRNFLSLPGKVGNKPWVLKITNGEQITTSPASTPEFYQYSVLIDSPLEMFPEVAPANITTGQSIRLSARLSLSGQPVTDAKTVDVEVTRPQDGMGNWLATNHVTMKELATIPESVGDEALSAVTRKIRFLTRKRKIPLPSLEDSATVQLYDDGTHGDLQAGDGIYCNEYTDTTRAGSYAFQFRATGLTDSESPYQREAHIERHIGVNVEASYIKIDTVMLDDPEKQERRFQVSVTPKDKFENFMGPRYAAAIRIVPSKGRLVGNIRDNLEGTYTQVVALPLGPPQAIDIAVQVGGENTSLRWTVPRDNGSNEICLSWWVFIVLIFALLILLAMVLTRRSP